MPWGTVACSKPVPHCGPTVDPSVRLWRCVGLHRGPRKPGSKARAAVFVGFASATLTLILGCRGVSQACHTLLARCGPFDTSLDGRWASPQPLEVRSKGKSGGVCRVHFRRLSALSWSLNDALGCCGVFEACLTLLAHCGPFGALFEGRWASPRPSKIGLKGKSGGVGGVSFCQLSALSWSLNDTLGCQGASKACHILW